MSKQASEIAFIRFCERLQLDPQAPDSEIHFQQWLDACERLAALGGGV